MSEPTPTAAGPQVPPKPGVSPARNIIGLIVLVAVIVVGWLEYSAKSGYNAAVTALNERMSDENLGLMPEAEAEAKLGKQPDGPGSRVTEGTATFTKKSYTWNGILKSYTLTAYYTNQNDPALHHIETEGAKYQPEKPAPPPQLPARAQRGGPMQGAPPSGERKKSGGARDGEARGGEARGGEKAEGAPGAQEKPQDGPKAAPGADQAPKANEPKPDEKAKAGADEKGKTPPKAG